MKNGRLPCTELKCKMAFLVQAATSSVRLSPPFSLTTPSLFPFSGDHNRSLSSLKNSIIALACDRASNASTTIPVEGGVTLSTA